MPTVPPVWASSTLLRVMDPSIAQDPARRTAPGASAASARAGAPGNAAPCSPAAARRYAPPRGAPASADARRHLRLRRLRQVRRHRHALEALDHAVLVAAHVERAAQALRPHAR